MIVAFVAFAAVAALLIVSIISMMSHIVPTVDMNHLKMDITFLAISLLSTLVMVHIIIKNRAEIKGLIFEDD